MSKFQPAVCRFFSFSKIPHTSYTKKSIKKRRKRKRRFKNDKTVRLDFKPVAKRTSEEAAFVVSAEHVAAINKSIEKKLEKNNRERRESEKEAVKYIVR